MFHVLAIGHFDQRALAAFRIEVTLPLDRATCEAAIARHFTPESLTGPTLRQRMASYEAGYVRAVYLVVGLRKDSVALALELTRETGCQVVDVMGRTSYSAERLAAMLGGDATSR